MTLQQREKYINTVDQDQRDQMLELNVGQAAENWPKVVTTVFKNISKMLPNISVTFMLIFLQRTFKNHPIWSH